MARLENITKKKEQSPAVLPGFILGEFMILTGVLAVLLAARFHHERKIIMEASA